MSAKQSTEITDVIFRRWKKNALDPAGGIIALFPYERHFPGEPNPGHQTCSSYEHIGQHGGADYSRCIERTVPATPEEYADLKAELESIGYNLRVIKRAQRRKMYGKQ